jgi:putative transposase
VQAIVEETKQRSGWPAKRTLAALGIRRGTYYRWLKEEAWAQEKKQEEVRPVQPYEALPEERAAVVAYARSHPEIRHRELSWRMIDEDVAYVSASTVYRILREEELMCRRRGRKKRYREEIEKATRPDERWATDLMYVKVGEAFYYYVGFLDEYSRYLVHWELLSSMDGDSVSLAGQAAVETLPRDGEGRLLSKPEIRTDHGSSYLSQEFHGLLEYHGLTHVKIRPHCPEENGLMERSNRTLREALEGEEFSNRYEAEEALGRIIRWYNTERLHSSLGYLRPMDYYRGNPQELHESRRKKLSAARHRRREKNLSLRQPTLALETDQPVTNH